MNFISMICCISVYVLSELLTAVSLLKNISDFDFLLHTCDSDFKIIIKH